MSVCGNGMFICGYEAGFAIPSLILTLRAVSA